jgi:hypothetical protein
MGHIGYGCKETKRTEGETVQHQSCRFSLKLKSVHSGFSQSFSLHAHLKGTNTTAAVTLPLITAGGSTDRVR